MGPLGGYLKKRSGTEPLQVLLHGEYFIVAGNRQLFFEVAFVFPGVFPVQRERHHSNCHWGHITSVRNEILRLFRRTAIHRRIAIRDVKYTQTVPHKNRTRQVRPARTLLYRNGPGLARFAVMSSVAGQGN